MWLAYFTRVNNNLENFKNMADQDLKREDFNVGTYSLKLDW